MSEQKSYHPFVEEVRRDRWGKLALIGKNDAEQWVLLNETERAQCLGAMVDCPVVNSLAKNPQYGPRYQIQRYADVTRAALQLADSMRESGSPLVEEFLAPVDLSQMGGKQLHDSDWVPPERMNQASGAETYYVAVMARQVIDARNTGKNRKDGSSHKRLALNEAAVAESLPMAVAKLGLLCEKKGIPSQKVASRMFPGDWAEELPKPYWEPIFAEVREVFEDLRKKK